MGGRTAWLGFGALLLCGCAIATFHQKDWGFDDAYISYRYADHLVAGHGLVFNPGERVEGYSNFLYVLLVAPGIALLGRDAAYAWSVALNALLLLGALAGVRAAAAVRVPSARQGWPGLLFAASPAIWIAAASGLETPLVLALFAAVWALVARLEAGLRAPAPALAAALAAIVLARADGFVMAGLVLAYLVVSRPAALGARGILLCAAAAIGTGLVQVAARLAYYGYPLPNTYYAKVGGELAERLRFAMQLLPQLNPVLPYVAIAVVVGLAVLAALPARMRAGGIRAAGASIPFEVFFAGGWLAYWFYVGGDVFGERFLLVLIPLGAVLLARARWLDRDALRWVGGALVLALLVAPWIGTPLRRERTVYDPWLTLGRFLAEHHPDAVVAIDAAGKIPYASQLRAIDSYGLNDPEIAHRKSRFVMPGHSNSDPYYVLGRRPDLITGWLNPSDLSIDPGLRAYLYRGEGYALRYLVFAARGVPPPDGAAIIPAADLSPEEIAARWRSGYRYGVIARSAPGS